MTLETAEREHNETEMFENINRTRETFTSKDHTVNEMRLRIYLVTKENKVLKMVLFISLSALWGFL